MVLHTKRGFLGVGREVTSDFRKKQKVGKGKTEMEMGMERQRGRNGDSEKTEMSFPNHCQ